MAISDKLKDFPVVLSTIVTLATIVGGYYSFDSVYARAGDLTQLETTLKSGQDTIRKELQAQQLSGQVEDLEDKLFVIEQKEKLTAADRAFVDRYQRRLQDKQRQLRSLK